MYDRRIEIDGELTAAQFGNTSALFESDMVMVDHQTGSYWMQVSGEALVGSLAGLRLSPLPSQTTTWGLWLAQYPGTAVLSQETGYNRNYRYDPFTGLGEQFNETGEFIFPVSDNGRDPRLDPGEVVLGVEYMGDQWAYPIERLGDGVILDEIGPNESVPIVIFSTATGPTGAAYRNEVEVNGEIESLEFFFDNDGENDGTGHYRDRLTESNWTLSGRATAGPLQGTQLEPLPTRSTFWFSLISSFPDLNFYVPE